MESLRVGQHNLNVERTLLRTPGSKNQRLKDAATCKGTMSPISRYHIAGLGDELYWVKEYMIPQPKGVAWEARRQQSLAGMVDTPDGPIGACEVFDWDDRCIIMQYLDGFKMLSQIKNGHMRLRILRQVGVWLEAKQVTEYDLSLNNVMVLNDVVVMVDFAYSPSITRQKQLVFLDYALW